MNNYIDREKYSQYTDKMLQIEKMEIIGDVVMQTAIPAVAIGVGATAIVGGAMSWVDDMPARISLSLLGGASFGVGAAVLTKSGSFISKLKRIRAIKNEQLVRKLRASCENEQQIEQSSEEEREM